MISLLFFLFCSNSERQLLNDYFTKKALTFKHLFRQERLQQWKVEVRIIQNITLSQIQLSVGPSTCFPGEWGHMVTFNSKVILHCGLFAQRCLIWCVMKYHGKNHYTFVNSFWSWNHQSDESHSNFLKLSPLCQHHCICPTLFFTLSFQAF